MHPLRGLGQLEVHQAAGSRDGAGLARCQAALLRASGRPAGHWVRILTACLCSFAWRSTRRLKRARLDSFPRVIQVLLSLLPTPFTTWCMQWCLLTHKVLPTRFLPPDPARVEALGQQGFCVSCCPDCKRTRAPVCAFSRISFHGAWAPSSSSRRRRQARRWRSGGPRPLNTCSLCSPSRR